MPRHLDVRRLAEAVERACSEMDPMRAGDRQRYKTLQLLLHDDRSLRKICLCVNASYEERSSD